MSEKIDWSKAPDDATHWEPKTANVIAGWMRLDGEKWFFWPISTRDASDIRWHECVNDMSVRSEYMIKRPTTPSWSGEGLPPVGVVCEVRNAPGGWGKATIKYQGKGIIVWLWDRPDGNTDQIEFASCPDRLQFRPIRTPEQIAADEREAAIKRACADIDKLVAAYNMSIDCSAAIRATIEALHDAGYRKP